MTNETEIDTIVIDKVMKFGDLLFCDCCYIGICLLYSPRVWRWSPSQNIVKQLHPVFSTYVEVILFPHTLHSADLSILHVCGGDPISSSSYKNINMYSPRMWRYCYIGIPEEIMNVIIRDHKEKF